MQSFMLVGLVALSCQITPAVDQQGTPAERGVIHEAYAQVAQGAPPNDNLLIPREPPEPLAEDPPDTRPEGDSVTWISGYWHFDDTRDDFIWVSGFWRQVPPGQTWIAGRFFRQNNSSRWRWQAGYWQSANAANVVVPEMPPVVAEAGPPIPAPAVNMFWSPGCQTWRGNRWVWRAGCWMGHRPGWVWYPATWVWAPNGYLFTPGYWDYALEYRGLLYAPVYYRQSVWQTRGFRHRPGVVICHEDLACGIFRRNGCGSYYYGDFFGAQLAGRGFNFWLGATVVSSQRADPLAGYYRHHRNADWVRGLEQYGRHRQEGRPVLPPAQSALSGREMVVLAGGNKNQAQALEKTGKQLPASLQARQEAVRLVQARELPKVDLRARQEPPQPKKEVLDQNLANKTPGPKGAGRISQPRQVQLPEPKKREQPLEAKPEPKAFAPNKPAKPADKPVDKPVAPAKPAESARPPLAVPEKPDAPRVKPVEPQKPVVKPAPAPAPATQQPAKARTPGAGNVPANTPPSRPPADNSAARPREGRGSTQEGARAPGNSSRPVPTEKSAREKDGKQKA